jgi:uncharacterized membrane protein YccC
VLVQATGLKEGAWVPLTIFIVLKPDYSSTMHLGLQRSAGTMLGGGLGVAAAQLGHLGPGGLIAAAGLSAAIAYAAFAFNYLIYSVFLTTFVVVIFDIAGHSAAPTAIARLIATAIGAVVAVAAYVAWPTWEGLTAQEKFSRLLEAHRDYIKAMLQALGGRNPDLLRLRSLQDAARLARSEAEASAARLGDEPQHPPLTPAIARSVIAPVNRLASAELALHALVISGSQPGQVLVDGGYHQPVDERVTALADALADAMRKLAVSLRTLRPPPELPALRPLQAALEQPPHPVDARLATVTDAMIDAIGTVESALRRRLSTLGASGRPTVSRYRYGRELPAGSKRVPCSSRWRASWWRHLTPSVRNAFRRW